MHCVGHYNRMARSALEAAEGKGGCGEGCGGILPMQRMSPTCARASRAHFHNGLGTYYHRTYVRIYIYARARITNRCITRRMRLAKVTCHSARFGLDASLSKSNDTLRINLAGITGHCEAARRNTTSHMKTILQVPGNWQRPQNSGMISIY